MMTYQRIKKLITNGNYNRESLLNQLDIFLLSNRLTKEQYEELVAMLGTN